MSRKTLTVTTATDTLVIVVDDARVIRSGALLADIEPGHTRAWAPGAWAEMDLDGPVHRPTSWPRCTPGVPDPAAFDARNRTGEEDD